MKEPESESEFFIGVPVSGEGVATAGIAAALLVLLWPLIWLLMFPLTLLIRFWPVVFAIAGLALVLLLQNPRPAPRIDHAQVNVVVDGTVVSSTVVPATYK